MGAHEVMQEFGIIDPHYSGNEVAPQQEYLPQNMFVRRLGVTLQSQETSPIILAVDPLRVRLAGIFADDLVVSGIRGGVHAEDEDHE
jgi:hypothetical protein